MVGVNSRRGVQKKEIKRGGGMRSIISGGGGGWEGCGGECWVGWGGADKKKPLGQVVTREKEKV